MTLEWPFDALGNRDLGYLIAREKRRGCCDYLAVEGRGNW